MTEWYDYEFSRLPDKEENKEYIDISKKEMKEKVKDICKEIINHYNSPFIKTEINSKEFVVDEKDIKKHKLRKATVSRGFIEYFQERVANELISFLNDKMKQNANAKKGEQDERRKTFE